LVDGVPRYLFSFSPMHGFISEFVFGSFVREADLRRGRDFSIARAQFALQWKPSVCLRCLFFLFCPRLCASLDSSRTGSWLSVRTGEGLVFLSASGEAENFPGRPLFFFPRVSRPPLYPFLLLFFPDVATREGSKILMCTIPLPVWFFSYIAPTFFCFSS